MHGGHELVREECPHDLANLVGGDHVRDPEPAGQLGRDRGLADPGHPAQQHHQRAAPGRRMFHHWRKRATTCSASSPTQHLLGERPQLLDRRPRPGPAPRAAPRSARASANERSGAQAGRHHRLRHQALGVGQAVVAADDDRLAARQALTRARVMPRPRRREPQQLGRPGRARPDGATGRLRRNTTSAPCAAPRALGDDVDRRRLQLRQEDVAAARSGAPDVPLEGRAAGQVPGRHQRDVQSRRARAARDALRRPPRRAVVKQRHARARRAPPRRARAPAAQATIASRTPLPPARSTSASRSAARARPRPSTTTSCERSSRSGPRWDSASRRGAGARWSRTRCGRPRTGGSAAPLPSTTTTAGSSVAAPAARPRPRSSRTPRRPGPRRSAGSRPWSRRPAPRPRGSPRRRARRRARSASSPSRSGSARRAHAAPAAAARPRPIDTITGRRPALAQQRRQMARRAPSCRSACRCRSPPPPARPRDPLRPAAGSAACPGARYSRPRSSATAASRIRSSPSSTGSPDRSTTRLGAPRARPARAAPAADAPAERSPRAVVRHGVGEHRAGTFSSPPANSTAAISCSRASAVERIAHDRRVVLAVDQRDTLTASSPASALPTSSRKSVRPCGTRAGLARELDDRLLARRTGTGARCAPVAGSISIRL